MDLMCDTKLANEESNLKMYEETDVRKYQGENDVTISYLKILKAKKIRMEKRRAERLK